MKRAVEHVAKGGWPVLAAVDAVTLDYDARFRRRRTLTTDGGALVLLDLAKAVAMADGDGLRLDGGGWLMVRAAPEELIEVRAEDPRTLTRLAWHLGNRHLPTELGDGVIRIRPDHVIEAMLQGLGARLSRVTAIFQPEGGAYGAGDHGHAHGGHGHGDLDHALDGGEAGVSYPRAHHVVPGRS